MVVLNSVVYRSDESEGFVCHSYELDQLGVGDSKEAAVRDLANGLEALFDVERQRGDIQLLRMVPEDIAKKFREVLKNPKDYIPIVENIGDVFVLHGYFVQDVKED